MLVDFNGNFLIYSCGLATKIEIRCNGNDWLKNCIHCILRFFLGTFIYACSMMLKNKLIEETKLVINFYFKMLLHFSERF